MKIQQKKKQVLRVPLSRMNGSRLHQVEVVAFDIKIGKSLVEEKAAVGKDNNLVR